MDSQNMYHQYFIEKWKYMLLRKPYLREEFVKMKQKWSANLSILKNIRSKSERSYLVNRTSGC